MEIMRIVVTGPVGAGKSSFIRTIAKHTKVDMIWVAGRSPTLVSYSLRGVAMNLKATTLTYLAILAKLKWWIRTAKRRMKRRH
jgi:nucleoside-triphosphatase THEP1